MAERREKEAPIASDDPEQPPMEVTPNMALAYSELSFSVAPRRS